jgi:hypothetical protein
MVDFCRGMERSVAHHQLHVPGCRRACPVVLHLAGGKLDNRF